MFSWRADTFVLLHGFTGAPESWNTLVHRLPAEARVLRPSLSRPATDSFDAEVDYLAEAIDSAGFTGAHLAGYSLGGRLALGLVARHAELISRATIIGAHAGLPSAERPLRKAADAELAESIRQRGVAAFVEHWESLPLFSTQRSLPAEILGGQRRIRLQNDAESLAQMLTVLGAGEMPALTAELENNAVPLTFLVGELDEKYVAIAERLVMRIGNSRIERVSGSGHNIVLENPAAVARALCCYGDEVPSEL